MLNQQDSDSGKEDESKKRGVQLVISGGNSAEPLNFLKETLDQVPLLVQMPSYRPRFRDITLGRNHIVGPMLSKVFPERPGTVRPFLPNRENRPSPNGKALEK